VRKSVDFVTCHLATPSRLIHGCIYILYVLLSYLCDSDNIISTLDPSISHD
jgi:hypothetical protein